MASFKLSPAIVVSTVVALCLGGIGAAQQGGLVSTKDNKTAIGDMSDKMLGASSEKASQQTVVDSASTPTTGPAAGSQTGDKLPCPPQVDSPSCSTKVSSKPDKTQPSKMLVFSQSNFVFRAGETHNRVVTVSASSGEPISMPGNTYDNHGPVFFSYSGGGSTIEKRTQWTMDLMVASDARPGNYQGKLIASASSASFQGAITVTVPNEPTFYISAHIEQSGVYNNIVIDITREAGFTESLNTELSSATPNVGMSCTFIESQNGGNRLVYYCYPDGGDAVSGMQLRAGVTVSGSSQSRSTSVYWTL